MPIGPFQLRNLLKKSTKKNEVLALTEDGGKALNTLGHSFITIELRKSSADNPDIKTIIDPELENFKPIQEINEYLIDAIKRDLISNEDYWDNLNQQGEKLELNEGNFALVRLEAFFVKDFSGVQFGVFTVPQLRGNHVTDTITKGLYATLNRSINDKIDWVIAIKEEMMILNPSN